MAYEQKDNTGQLRKNDRANSEKSPQATGSAIIDGVAYFVDAWTNFDKNGNRYQSLKFKRKDKQPGAPAPQREHALQPSYDRDDPRTGIGSQTANDLDDELPF